MKYCKEQIRLHGRTIEIHVPMVSFCDIPFSQIKNHVSSYGSYGIGLSREWAVRNRLNPVLYMQSDSVIAESYRGLIKLLDQKEKAGILGKELRRRAKDIIRYTKNYEGPLERKGKVVDGSYRFSDEREWRYVPPLSDDHRMMYTAREFKEAGRSVANESVSELRLQFLPEDIKYIIIMDDEEIGDISDFAHSKKAVYTALQQHQLMARVITSSQIMTDF
ncbi:abortive infection system antitoxin AbiGi family protein [Stenotrophomonas maltophilia]|uniref:abortive infection system antitoxin AbiGi family protein n=1 Tax=Stenotrophomonas maltophilia TaxID=40324 RepID=UPI001130515D|nr:abortive infection system antitoxin AbiGi family protein [Stenotrophomonas maltophilia]QGL67281.1 hypothetical protein FEO86_08300 [Stenotrophomonas maltophilia]